MRVHKHTRNIPNVDSVIEMYLNVKTNCRMCLEVTESEIAIATTTTTTNNNNSAVIVTVA